MLSRSHVLQHAKRNLQFFDFLLRALCIGIYLSTINSLIVKGEVENKVAALCLSKAFCNMPFAINGFLVVADVDFHLCSGGLVSLAI